MEYLKKLIARIYTYFWLQIIYRPFFAGKFSFADLDFTVGGFERVFKKQHLSVGVKGKANLHSKKNKSIIFYGNHPSWFDWLFVGYFLLKKFGDFKVVALLHNVYFFPLSSNNIIPVSCLRLTRNIAPNAIKSWFDNLVEDLNPKEAMVMNRRVPKLMSEALQSHTPTLIFPTGGESDQTWLSGISRAALEFKAQNNNEELIFQPFRISSFSNLELVLYGWMLKLGFNVNRKISIQLGKSFKMDDLELPDHKINKKKIASLLQILEDRYKQEFNY